MMTEEEFESLEAEGEERVGRCPFCGQPGFIVSDDWRQHFAGTYDLFQGSDPICPIVDGEPFDRFIRVFEKLQELPKSRKRKILAAMSTSTKEFLEEALDQYPMLFWVPFVESESLSVDIDEDLSSTTYEAVFVPDFAEARAALARMVEEALKQLNAGDGATMLHEK